jgi:hypothetical protein
MAFWDVTPNSLAGHVTLQYIVSQGTAFYMCKSSDCSKTCTCVYTCITIQCVSKRASQPCLHKSLQRPCTERERERERVCACVRDEPPAISHRMLCGLCSWYSIKEYSNTQPSMNIDINKKRVFFKWWKRWWLDKQNYDNDCLFHWLIFTVRCSGRNCQLHET